MGDISHNQTFLMRRIIIWARNFWQFFCLNPLIYSASLTTAEDFTYPQMADDYFALAKVYPEYFRMQGESIYFIDHSFLGSSSLIVHHKINLMLCV